MRVMVTGAGGFVGGALVQRLLSDPQALPRPVARLVAIDRSFGPEAERWRADPRVERLDGDFSDGALLERALADAPDCVFHLASVPGSLAEREPALGFEANLLAPIALLRRVARGRSSSGTPPRVVFASSVAVYGAWPAAGTIDESHPVRPALSYGAHKLMTEIFLADLTRRGELDGVSLRLPGIVARPISAAGHGSAFMSDMIRRLAAGAPFDCPVSIGARAWWMSLPCCVENLLHAARLPAQSLMPEPTLQLPVLSASMGELVEAIEALTGHCAIVRWRPDARTEALFGRMPRLETPRARSLGFVDDGDLGLLLRRALGGAPHARFTHPSNESLA